MINFNFIETSQRDVIRYGVLHPLYNRRLFVVDRADDRAVYFCHRSKFIAWLFRLLVTCELETAARRYWDLTTDEVLRENNGYSVLTLPIWSYVRRNSTRWTP